MGCEGRAGAIPAGTHPFLPLAGAFGAGILLATRLSLPPAAWAAGSLGCVAALLLAWRFGYARIGRALAAASFLGLGAQAMGAVLVEAPPNHLSRLPEAWLSSPIRLEGWVAIPPDPLPDDRRDAPGGDRTRFVAELIRLTIGGREVEVTGRARLTLYGESVPLRYGEVIRGSFRLRHPRAFGNPGAFDYPGYLASQGVFLEGWSREPLEVGPPGAGSRLLTPVFSLRSLLLRRFDEALSPERAAPVKAMVLGDRSGLSPAMVDAFLGSGTFHILAISGLNVSLLAGALFGGLRLCRIPARLAAVCSMLLVTLYAGLAGAGPSVVRAAIMADVFLLAIALDRRVTLLNSLALAALAILWWNPRALFEVGFQLTFLATLGIVLLVGRAETVLQRFPRPVRYLAASMAITLVATLMTAPILAAAFNRLTPVGLLANLPVVPLAGAITTVGLLAGAGLLLFPDGVPGLTQAAGGLVDLLDVLTRWFAAWPGASLVVYGPTPGMTLCYYGALVGAYLAAGGAGGAGRLRIRQAVCGSLAGLSALLCAGQILLRLFPLAAPEAVRLTMLDVGQGEAMFLELPGRTRILVDAGGRFGESSDMGRRVVVPFLWHAWIGRLDALVVSHAETDHAQGVAGVLDLMPVAEVWTGPPIEGSVTAIWLEELLRQRRIPQRVLAADSPPFRAGGAVVRILHPSAPGVAGDAGARPGAANEASLVLRIELAERAILLTGDIGRDGEAALLAAGRSLRAQLLKVPHHGSRTSSSGAFLAAVDPDSAIVSVGYRNQFRHPHPEVVERIESRSVRLLRTDRDGAIEVEMSGAGLRIRGHREREP